jgi:FkbM family methyltransferase
VNLWARPSRAVELSIDDYNRNLLVSQGQHSVQAAAAEAGYLADRLSRLTERRAGQALETGGEVPTGATSCHVRLAQGPEFEVTVDETAQDPLTSAYLSGQGHRINEHLVEVMLELVKPGDRVLDLGAFVGTFSLAAAAAGCEVCAIEASEENAALLRLSRVRNRFTDMRVIQAAVTDRPQTLNFQSRGPWGRVMESEGDSWDAVLGIRVDDLVTQLGWDSVDFMKMDVEGWEMKAIRGMAKLLESPEAPPLILESNGHTLAFYDATPQKLCRQLEELGYRCYLVEPGRFVEVSPNEIQPQTVVDWLAVKGPLPDIPGYSLQPGLNRQELIHVLVTEGSLVIDHHRAHVARTLADAPDEILSHERILKLLRSLQKDPSELVRSAVAWFDGGSGDTER